MSVVLGYTPLSPSKNETKNARQSGNFFSKLQEGDATWYNFSCFNIFLL